jgi:uncharacterized protein (DUF2164 family)
MKAKEPRTDSPMRIKLSGERRARLLELIKKHHLELFDEPLSDFRAAALLDFFVELGPPVYNQAIRDAHAFMAEKLTDLEGEVYEPDRSAAG